MNKVTGDALNGLRHCSEITVTGVKEQMGGVFQAGQSAPAALHQSV